MTSVPPQGQRWLVQPLLEAGLGEEELRVLLYRLAFEAIVSDRADGATALADLARDHPPALQRAWLEMLDRMLGGEEPSAASPR